MSDDLCKGCGLPIRRIDSHGCSDDMPDHCDSCWAKAHRAGVDEPEKASTLVKRDQTSCHTIALEFDDSGSPKLSAVRIDGKWTFKAYGANEHEAIARLIELVHPPGMRQEGLASDSEAINSHEGSAQ